MRPDPTDRPGTKATPSLFIFFFLLRLSFFFFSRDPTRPSESSESSDSGLSESDLSDSSSSDSDNSSSSSSTSESDRHAPSKAESVIQTLNRLGMDTDQSKRVRAFLKPRRTATSFSPEISHAVSLSHCPDPPSAQCRPAHADLEILKTFGCDTVDARLEPVLDGTPRRERGKEISKFQGARGCNRNSVDLRVRSRRSEHRRNISCLAAGGRDGPKFFGQASASKVGTVLSLLLEETQEAFERSKSHPDWASLHTPNLRISSIAYFLIFRSIRACTSIHTDPDTGTPDHIRHARSDERPLHPDELPRHAGAHASANASVIPRLPSPRLLSRPATPSIRYPPLRRLSPRPPTFPSTTNAATPVTTTNAATPVTAIATTAATETVAPTPHATRTRTTTTKCACPLRSRAIASPLGGTDDHPAASGREARSDGSKRDIYRHLGETWNRVKYANEAPAITPP